MIITENHCLRCGHVWFPRSEKIPINCPRCHSPSWNKERKVKKE